MSSYLNVVCLFVSMLVVIRAQNQPIRTSKSKSRSVYTFGDSFVDPGNNNYRPNVARSNFPPYGRDFVKNKATGRFSNGRLFPDFLAYHFGAKQYQRPYLDNSSDLYLNERVTAVSFASATTGYDSVTSDKSNAIPMLTQLEYFKQYKANLEKTKGKKKADKQIRKAVFYVNAGSDDIAFSYFNDGGNQSRPRPRPDQYVDRIINLAKQFIQGLSDEGARKIAVTGLPPLGCIPVAITLLPPDNSEGMPAKRNCLNLANKISEDFNLKLQDELNLMQGLLSKSSTKIAYIDFELPLLELIQNPDKYGYTEVNRGCCGTGLHEIGALCNQTTPVCVDNSKYVFWDAAHPTEKAYEFIFLSNLPSIVQLTST